MFYMCEDIYKTNVIFYGMEYTFCFCNSSCVTLRKIVTFYL